MYGIIRNQIMAVVTMMLWLLSGAQAQAIETYIFRGAGDFTFIADRLSFSEGMDTLGDKINAAGMFAKVYRWEAGEFAYREIMRRKPDSVALIGHSMGALTSLAIAARLKNSGIRVAYLGTIDIPGPVGATPANVEVAENYFHAFPVFGQLTRGPGHKGTIANHFVWGQIHITMDNSKKVHNGMLAAITKVRDEDGVMRAYAAQEPEPQENNLVASVDKVLTGSTTHAGAPEPSAAIPGAASSHQLPPPVEYEPQQMQMAMAVPDPASIPVPTPRPSLYATKTGLPPIE